MSFFERMSAQVQSNLLASFLPFCLSKVEHMAEIGRRKIVVMALLSLLPDTAVLSLPEATQFVTNLVITASSVVIVRVSISVLFSDF